MQPPPLACSEQMTCGTADEASRCTPATTTAAGAGPSAAPARDFSTCFAKQQQDAAADSGKPAPPPAALQPPTVHDAFDAILGAEPQTQLSGGGAAAFRPGRFLAASQIPAEASGALSGAAAPSAMTAEQSVTEDLDGPSTANSPHSQAGTPAATQAATQASKGLGETTPKKAPRIPLPQGQHFGLQDDQFVSPAAGPPVDADAAAAAAPPGPTPLQADAVSPCKAQAAAPARGSAVAAAPPQPLAPQPLQAAEPAAKTPQQQPSPGGPSQAPADRRPLAAVQTPHTEGRKAQTPPAEEAGRTPQAQAAGSGKKRKSATPASHEQRRASRTRRQSAATPEAHTTAGAALSGPVTCQAASRILWHWLVLVHRVCLPLQAATGVRAASLHSTLHLTNAPVFTAGTWEAAWHAVDLGNGEAPVGRWGASLLTTGASEVCGLTSGSNAYMCAYQPTPAAEPQRFGSCQCMVSTQQHVNPGSLT